MTHFRKTLRTALASQIVSAGTAAGSRVYTTAYDQRDVLPAITIDVVGESQDVETLHSNSATAVLARGLQVQVIGEVRQASAGAQDALDDLMEQIEAACTTFFIAGLKSIRAQGYSQDDSGMGNQQVLVGRQRYQLMYFTTQSTPSVAM